MQIKPVTIHDIPYWEALSAEYDDYILELVGDLNDWYEGSDDSMAFSSYMKSKIGNHEAFMAINDSNQCLGIIAFSKSRNKITFFGVSHDADFFVVGKTLLLQAFQRLDTTHDICIQEICSQSEWIEQHRALLYDFHFKLIGRQFENGAPVDVFLKSPHIS